MSKWVYNIKGAIVALEEEIEILQNKADSVVAKPLPLEEYQSYRSKTYAWTKWNDVQYSSYGDFDRKTEYFYKKDSNYYSKFPSPFEQIHIDQALDIFDNTYNQWKEDNKEIKEKNREIIIHNQLQVERVKSIMKTLGVSDKHSTWEYKRSNSKNKTEIKHNAGYLSDLSRTVVIHDNYDRLCKMIEDKRKSVEDYGKKLLKESQDRQRELQKEESAKLEVVELAGLRAKYTPANLSSDEDTLLEVILSKDKYMNLAYWLERNRGDWSDGYSYAERGLSDFEVVTRQDQLVEDDIQDCIDDWYGDGRVFRDTTWNYSVLYGLVEDKVLLKDLEIIQKYTGDY